MLEMVGGTSVYQKSIENIGIKSLLCRHEQQKTITMTKLLFTILFVWATGVAALAQDTTSVAAPGGKGYQKDKDKEQIAINDLPEGVRASLTSQDYIGWAVGNAFKKEKGNKTFYFVELTKGSETKQLKFDAKGNKSDEKDKGSQR